MGVDEVFEFLHLDPEGDVVVHQLALEQRKSAKVPAYRRVQETPSESQNVFARSHPTTLQQLATNCIHCNEVARAKRLK